MVIRNANIDDCKQYFDWVNEETVRLHSFNTELIKWNDHQKWFENKLNSQSSHLYVCEIGSDIIGQVRFDLVDNYYNIDYSIDKEFRGKGYAYNMLFAAIQKLKDLTQTSFFLKAEVKRDNFASLRVFEKLEMDRILVDEIVRFEKHVINNG